MNTMPMTTTSLRNIDSCWLYQDRLYKYVENGRVVPFLPKVDLCYKPILDANNISYRKDAIGLSYELWDPECYSEHALTLPLFIQVDKSFRWIKKYTAQVVTPETSKAAFALMNRVVQPEIDKIKKEKQHQELVNALVTALNGRTACGIDCNRHFDLRSCNQKEMDVVSGQVHIKILPVNTLMTEKKHQELIAFYVEQGMNPDTIQTVLNTDCIAIFDMSQMATGTTVELQVPVGTEPMFVGRNGWQVKKWCEELGGLLKINVKAAK